MTKEDKYAEMSSELALWKSLLAHPAWKTLDKIAEGQINERARTLLHSPLQKMDDALAQEFTKGEASGIELFKSIPQVEYERIESDLQNLEKEQEDETRSGSTSSGSPDSNGDELGALDPGIDPFGE
jgi:hypothetical protein